MALKTPFVPRELNFKILSQIRRISGWSHGLLTMITRIESKRFEFYPIICMKLVCVYPEIVCHLDIMLMIRSPKDDLKRPSSFLNFEGQGVVLVPSSGSGCFKNFEIYLVFVLSCNEDEAGRGPSPLESEARIPTYDNFLALNVKNPGIHPLFQLES